ncbi:MAG: hypothetical protein AAGE84_24290 [Cyanobacteria bacterium P01_G01_bin.39]
MDIEFNIVCNGYIAIVTEKTVPVKGKSGTLTPNAPPVYLAIAVKFNS